VLAVGQSPYYDDLARPTYWLVANGFQIIGGSREEGYIRFTGDAASTERVFNTDLEDFGDGKSANVTEAQIQAQFAKVIGDILGMQNLGHLEPRERTGDVFGAECFWQCRDRQSVHPCRILLLEISDR